MHKGHEGDVNLPKPQANWRFPPDPYSHPEIKRRDWSLREKADSQEWEVMGPWRERGAASHMAQLRPRKVGSGSLKQYVTNIENVEWGQRWWINCYRDQKHQVFHLCTILGSQNLCCCCC